jgi:hypothetical protein
MPLDVYVCVYIYVFFLPSSIDVAAKNDHYYFDKHMYTHPEKKRKRKKKEKRRMNIDEY